MKNNYGEVGGLLVLERLATADLPEECIGTVSCTCANAHEHASAPESHPDAGQALKVNIEMVMSFQFDPLIHRMVDKYGWDEAGAYRCFEDMKKYLYLCASSGKSLAPSKKIDEMWHNFILFTMDYSEFCLTRLGRYIHHRPRRRGEAFEKMANTAEVARKAFGDLSPNWFDPKANDDCGTCMACASCHNCSNT